MNKLNEGIKKWDCFANARNDKKEGIASFPSYASNEIFRK